MILLRLQDVLIGNLSQYDMTLTNANSATAYLVIDDITTSNSVFSVISYPDSLLPGESDNITIGFSPQNSGEETGDLTILSNDNNSPHAISLSGTGVIPPDISINILLFLARIISTHLFAYFGSILSNKIASTL